MQQAVNPVVESGSARAPKPQDILVSPRPAKMRVWTTATNPDPNTGVDICLYRIAKLETA